MAEPRIIQGAWGRLDVRQAGGGLHIDHADPDIRIRPEVMAELMTQAPWASVIPERGGVVRLVIFGTNRAAAYRMRWSERYGLWYGHQA